MNSRCFPCTCPWHSKPLVEDFEAIAFADDELRNDFTSSAYGCRCPMRVASEVS